MVFVRIVASKDPHHVMHFFFILGFFTLYLSLFLAIEYATVDQKIFPSVSFLEPTIVNIDDFKLHLNILFSIIFMKLHLRQKKLSIIIIFHLKLLPFWQVSHYPCHVVFFVKRICKIKVFLPFPITFGIKITFF
jgi:hypothetical protein